MINFIHADHPKPSDTLPGLVCHFYGDTVTLEEAALPPEPALIAGILNGSPVYAITSDTPGTADLRELQHLLSPDRLMAVNRARQLVNWSDNHRFCGKCGAPTQLGDIEPAYVCTICDTHYYPRLDPAIIVAVIRNGELLLARNAKFKSGMFSLVAGFIEGGETMEQAVAREVREEVGIEVENVRYFRSQAWPFPHALMLGCVADYRAGDIVPDGKEIIEAGFFAKDALPVVPRPGSVAANLIAAYIDGKLEKY